MQANLSALIVTLLVLGTPTLEPADAQDIDGGKPRLLLRIEPKYPEAAVAAKLSGYVTLEFTIGVRGAQDIVVIDSSDPIFNEAAVNALRKWRFMTLAADGTPVLGRRVRETIKFNSN